VSDLRIEKLNHCNFTLTSLDRFERRQEVNMVWRSIDGEYRLVSEPFTECWSLERKRAKAEDILSGRYISWGAFADDRVVGIIEAFRNLEEDYLIIDSFHVSAECRRQGIGRKLFRTIRAEGQKLGAKALYASCCSSEETIAFYRAMGFELTERPIKHIAEDEPFDLQMVCPIEP